jgi:hypothetical protein
MAGKGCFRIVVVSVIMLSSNIVAAAPPSDAEITKAWSRLPNSFLGVSCERLPWLPEAVSVICSKDDRIKASGSIEFDTPPMDHEALIETVRKKNSKIPGFEILSSEKFEIKGSPNTINVHVVYKTLLGDQKKRSIWISWADNQITRVLVNELDEKLPSDIHYRVGKSFLGESQIIIATQQVVIQ